MPFLAALGHLFVASRSALRLYGSITSVSIGVYSRMAVEPCYVYRSLVPNWYQRGQAHISGSSSRLLTIVLSYSAIRFVKFRRSSLTAFGRLVCFLLERAHGKELSSRGVPKADGFPTTSHSWTSCLRTPLLTEIMPSPRQSPPVTLPPFREMFPAYLTDIPPARYPAGQRIERRYTAPSSQTLNSLSSVPPILPTYDDRRIDRQPAPPRRRSDASLASYSQPEQSSQSGSVPQPTVATSSRPAVALCEPRRTTTSGSRVHPSSFSGNDRLSASQNEPLSDTAVLLSASGIPRQPSPTNSLPLDMEIDSAAAPRTHFQFDIFRPDATRSSLKHITSSSTIPRGNIPVVHQRSHPTGVGDGTFPIWQVRMPEASSTVSSQGDVDNTSRVKPASSRRNRDVPGSSLITFPSVGMSLLPDRAMVSGDEAGGPSDDPYAPQADASKKHICHECSKRFNRPSSLKIHLNTHTGATPFKCPVPGCGREFNVNSNMKRHFRNHSAGGGLSRVNNRNSQRRRRRRNPNRASENSKSSNAAGGTPSSSRLRNTESSGTVSRASVTEFRVSFASEPSPTASGDDSDDSFEEDELMGDDSLPDDGASHEDDEEENHRQVVMRCSSLALHSSPALSCVSTASTLSSRSPSFSPMHLSRLTLRPAFTLELPQSSKSPAHSFVDIKDEEEDERL